MGFYERKIFPMVIENVMTKKEFAEQRHVVLNAARGNILEIGFGTGLNLDYYPSTIKHIDALDINPGMNKTAANRIAKSNIGVDLHCIDGKSLPFGDHCFDTVVSTWTLCSIADIDAALKEIRRVLRPDGRLLFIEHGLAESTRIQWWQHKLTPIQKVLGCGCHLNRAIDTLIERAGFTITALDRFILTAATPLAGSMFRGQAVNNLN